ncbi:MAG TPA: hypothetical protein GXX46_00390 [Peptococcaceae bacterium]|nr:hypothetical protein [Peptococcaceae bacterium]
MFRQIGFMPIKDPTGIMWLKERLEQPWGRSDGCNYAASVIPRGYESYAKIFHPAYLEEENREITWTELARNFNRKPHSEMQWQKIIKHDSSFSESIKLREPAIGHFPSKQVKALIEVLRKFTKTPDNCLFAVWEGWGGLEAEKRWPEAARFHVPERNYVLLGGPLEAAAISVLPFCEQSASVWWPRDRAWCVATEIDLMFTFVGGTFECIEELLALRSLEVYPAKIDDRVDINGDKINI